VALTMTRTRTQTALTKLAERIANAHGELAFVEEQLGKWATGRAGEVGRGLEHRHAELVAARDALYATVRQFDPSLAPESIGAAEEWLKPFGRGAAAQRRYLQERRAQVQPRPNE
jgi:hypothetical protein